VDALQVVVALHFLLQLDQERHAILLVPEMMAIVISGSRMISCRMPANVQIDDL
jgi:hypothetical protein